MFRGTITMVWDTRFWAINHRNRHELIKPPQSALKRMQQLEKCTFRWMNFVVWLH